MSDAVADRLPELLVLKHPPGPGLGWAPILRNRMGYCTPDDWYEATLLGLVTERTRWLDVGCGRELLPGNRAAGELLARRAARVVGLDPSSNIYDNGLIHERIRCRLEDYVSERRFDLITMRMVAEHIEYPTACAAALARLLTPGGRVVVYTVSKWSPASLAAAVTPMSVHHAVKAFLWGSQEADTFPTCYRMNTRKTLERLFAVSGLSEVYFRTLDDCRTMNRWRLASTMELVLWRILTSVGLRYPECCLLGICRLLDQVVAVHLPTNTAPHSLTIDA